MVLASQYVENCAIVAGFSLTAYDYLLNIGLEFELIWRKRSWRTLMLYGIMRYAGLLWAIGTLLSVVNIQLSNTRCFLLKSLLETSEIIIVYLLQAMMAYRAYFVARNQMNSALLVTGFTIVQSLNGAALVVYLSSPVISDIHAFGSKSCSLATPSDAQWIYPLASAALLMFEAVIFTIVLWYTYGEIRAYGWSTMKFVVVIGRLLRVVLRNNLIYFAM